MTPSERVLDLFAVPGDVEPLPGGEGHTVRAGDLALSPGRSASFADPLYPVLARLAATLDGALGGRHARRREVRMAMPVPARDGSWVVDGWAATRFEAGARPCTDAAVVRAAGFLLHAELASLVSHWAPASGPPLTRWDRAAQVAFGAGDPDLRHADASAAALARDLLARRTDEPLGVDQLVHGDLANNVLLDADDRPLVIDFSPYWRPALWADAVAVLDLVMWKGADPALIGEFTAGRHRQAMIRAGIYRVLSDRDPDEAHVQRYRDTLAPLL